MAQSLGKTLFWQGDLSNLEAISTFSLQNALRRAQELGIILRKRATDSKRQLIALDPAWAQEDELATWVERVGTFRREGKSRRTNELGRFFLLCFSPLCVHSLTAFLAAARRVFELAISLKLPALETTPWPLIVEMPAADFTTASPLPARL